MTSLPAHPFLMGVLRGSDPETLFPLARKHTDWEEIVSDAAARGFTPLLYRWLKRSDTGRRLPPSVAARLEGQYFGLAARNMLLSSELGSVLRAFEEQRVPCAPLRGLALAERLYGDITARPIGDIDLLVHKEDLPRVATILRGLGFREMDHRAGFARAFSYTLVFLKDRHGWIIIEPHWTIAYPPFVDRVDMQEVWERCARGQVVGVEAWLLNREELLLHLCLHLTHPDRPAPLLWFYELDQLVRQEEGTFDWSRLLSIAQQGELGFLLSQALAKVKALFATPIPDHVLDRLPRQPSRSVEGRLVRLFVGASSVEAKEELALLFTLKGFRARLHYALGLLFPSPHYMTMQHGYAGRTQLGFGYFRRFCRLSRECLRGVMRLLFSAPRWQSPPREDRGGPARAPSGGREAGAN